MNTLTFNKYFETYTNHHSFTDLLNLCKEVSDYVYNKDIINSDYFDSFKETKNGYEILFNRSGKKNYFIDAKKEKVKDEKGDDQLIDSVYEDIESLYNIIKNYEMVINIKQIDEEMKSFNEIILENDIYGLREEVSDIFKDKFDYTKYKKIIDNEIDFLLNTIDRHYDNRPSKEQLRIEIDRISNDISYEISKLKENIMNEGLEEEVGPKLSDKYISLKRAVMELLDKTLNGDVTRLQSFIDSYVDPDSEEIIEGLVEDADIFDFYLKVQADVDQILLDRNYYDDPPEVESLYDYVIDGTYDAVVYCLEDIKNELYGE